VFAAFGALLFGIHPMHVESVAWISERKDLLCALFSLASILLYINYLNRHSNKLLFFLLSLLLFTFALFSRITAVTLPLILFLIDYFSERRFTTKVFVEKIPFLFLSVGFGVVEIVVFQHQGILKIPGSISIVNQVFLGFFALSTYILKFVAPFHLSAIYPFPGDSTQALPVLYYLSPVFILGLGYIIYRSTRKYRAILFGSLFFLVNIILMFQIQILTQGIGFRADRFSYMSYIGFCFLAGWTIEQIVQKKPELKNLVMGVSAIILILFSTLTFTRTKVWENDFTLWNDTISKYPEEVSKSYGNRGIAFTSIGQWNEAISDFTKVIAIDPKYSWGYLDRGEAYQHTNQWDKSIEDLSTAIRIDSNSQEGLAGRGFAYGVMGLNEKAIDDLSRAIQINPKYAKGYSNRGVTYSNMGLYDKAVADLSKAIELDTAHYDAYLNRSIAYGKLNRWDEAIIDGQKALKFHPDNAGLHDKIGYYYLGKGDLLQAEEEFKKAINIDITGFDPYLGLAIIFYSKGYKADAKSYLDQAKGIEPAINTGMDGINALEKAGYPKPDAVKETLKRMLAELK
jgi:tetratricopeptide (TPR) repeat protein